MVDREEDPWNREEDPWSTGKTSRHVDVQELLCFVMFTQVNDFMTIETDGRRSSEGTGKTRKAG